MWVFWIIAFLAVFIIIKLLLRNDSCTPDGSNGMDALAILKQRFASGEIDEETFEKMKKSLDD